MRDVSGKYRLVCKLGCGGMGQVWRGIWYGREGDVVVMPCAIKILHPALAETERDRQRFFNEARIAAQLDHGRIVKVTDVSEVGGLPCLVMDWVDGVNLREFTTKIGVRLELDVCLHVVGEILAALEYAHERTIGGEDAGVIHYDVTPGNILISSSGEVKLTDFGIARFAAAVDGTMSRSVGTPRYMSPEQLLGRARRETDIYSLGVVLHELLEGARFLDGYDRQHFQTLVLGGHVPELSRPEVPAWVDQLRRQMLANRPDDRPQAADARSLILQKTGQYHLAGQRLRELYQRVIGERRSGLTDQMNASELFTAPRHQHESVMATPAPEATSPRSAQGHAQTSACPPVFDDGKVDATEVLQPPAPPRRSLRLVAGLGGYALLLFGVTIGLLVSGRKRESERASQPTALAEAQSTPPAKHLAAARDEPEGYAVPASSERAFTVAVPEGDSPLPVPEPELEIEPETAPVPEPEPEPDPEPDPEQVTLAQSKTQPAASELKAETSEPETSEPKPAKKRAPKVEVTFVISGVSSAEIKIGSRPLTYNHVAMTKLLPAKYIIRWRESADQPWHRSGTLNVEEVSKGSYYEVRLGLKDIHAIKRAGGSAQ